MRASNRRCRNWLLRTQRSLPSLQAIPRERKGAPARVPPFQTSALFCCGLGEERRTILAPRDLLYPTDDEEPRHGAGESDGGDDGEGPIEVSGTGENEAGDDGHDDSSNICNAILKTDPSPCGLRTGEGLRNRPDVGG